jgi:hypothetical protein
MDVGDSKLNTRPAMVIAGVVEKNNVSPLCYNGTINPTERLKMTKYIVTATGTTEYSLEVEAESAEEARSLVQYKSSDQWLAGSYEFAIGYVEEATN